MTLLPRLRATLAIALALAAAIVTTVGASARAADSPPAAPGVKKVLRVAFSTAETSFDPSRINDIYSSTVCAHDRRGRGGANRGVGGGLAGELTQQERVGEPSIREDESHAVRHLGRERVEE